LSAIELISVNNVTIVIPTKNEEKSISEIMDSVKRYGDEILIVDGHSKDRTRDVASRKGARVVLDGGKGKGDGIRTAIREAKGDIIVFIDADGSHIPADIPELVKPIKEGKADLVIASRMRGGSDELYGNISEAFRLIMSVFINLIINYRFSSHITDSQNGFRAIRKSAAEKLDLKADKFDIEEEMLMKCLKKGFRVSEIPSMELKRKYGKSNISLWKMWHRYMWRIFVNLF